MAVKTYVHITLFSRDAILYYCNVRYHSSRAAYVSSKNNTIWWIVSYITWSRDLLRDSWELKISCQIRYENIAEVTSGPVRFHAIYRLISIFSQIFLHTSAHISFYVVLGRVLWMDSLLIATGVCLIFMLLNNQKVLYNQANQKRCLIYWRDPQLIYYHRFQCMSVY